MLEKIEFITITVDPWRDNTTVLEEWKEATKSYWTHLTVADTQPSSEEMAVLTQVWNDFDVGFKIEENTTESKQQQDITHHHMIIILPTQLTVLAIMKAIREFGGATMIG